MIDALFAKLFEMKNFPFLFCFTKIINFILVKFPFFYRISLFFSLSLLLLLFFLGELTQVWLSKLSQTWVDSPIKRRKERGGRNFWPSSLLLHFFCLFAHFSLLFLLPLPLFTSSIFLALSLAPHHLLLRKSLL